MRAVQAALLVMREQTLATPSIPRAVHAGIHVAALLPAAGAKLEIFAACSEKRLCARQWFRKRRRGTAP